MIVLYTFIICWIIVSFSQRGLNGPSAADERRWKRHYKRLEEEEAFRKRLYGATEAEAIADLMRLLQEEAEYREDLADGKHGGKL